MTPHERIFVDNQKAHDYASKYLAAVDDEMFARCLMLTSAKQTFGAFLNLPESSSKLMAIFSTALTVLSFVQPELFFVKFLGEEEKAVKLALAIGVATGSKSTKAIVMAAKVGEFAEKGKGGLEKYNGYKENQEKKHAAPEASERLKKLASGRTPIQQMLAAYRQAQSIWSSALDALDKELERRLNATPHAAPPKESLEAIARRLLEFPTPFTDGELDQVETLYLWNIVSAWARESISITYTRRDPYVVNNEVSFMGINDTQRYTLQEWFGFNATRGKIFYESPMFSRDDVLLLVRLGAKQSTLNLEGVPRRAGPF